MQHFIHSEKTLRLNEIPAAIMFVTTTYLQKHFFVYTNVIWWRQGYHDARIPLNPTLIHKAVLLMDLQHCKQSAKIINNQSEGYLNTNFTLWKLYWFIKSQYRAHRYHPTLLKRMRHFTNILFSFILVSLRPELYWYLFHIYFLCFHFCALYCKCALQM